MSGGGGGYIYISSMIVVLSHHQSSDEGWWTGGGGRRDAVMNKGFVDEGVKRGGRAAVALAVAVVALRGYTRGKLPPSKSIQYPG